MHAVRSESNIQKFLIAEVIVVLIGQWIGIFFIELFVVLLSGTMFFIVELFNTAIERLADTFDDEAKKHHAGHYHLGVKQTKDVAAAASLIALLVHGIIIFIVYFPYFLLKFYPNA